MGNKLSRFIIVGVCVFFTTISFAQNNSTSSPYSRFGVGDLHSYSFGRFAAMGGASIGSRHQVQINTSNPASYAAIDSMSFIFEFGADVRFSEHKTTNASVKTNDANFRYFTLSWPVTRWAAASVGVLPYADKGYDIYFEEESDDIGRVGHNYFGTGSLSKAYFGTGINLTETFSVGVNVYYLFGTLRQNNSISFPDDASQFNFNETEKIRLRDFSYTLGLQYDVKLKNDDFLTIGATLNNKPKFTAFHDLLQEKYLQYGTVLFSDTISHIVEDKSSIQLPTSYGVGLSYNKLDKLEINADYYYSKWGSSTFFGQTIPELTDQSRISLGIEYTPNAKSIRSYFPTIKYRVGLHTDNSYLTINDRRIKEFGMSFGLGLPMNRTSSTINIAAEFGKRGTTRDGLIKENYSKISLYLTLYDRWFVKSKFN